MAQHNFPRVQKGTNPFSNRASCVKKRICTNAGYNAHKPSHQTARARKNSPLGFETAQTKKRYAQGFSAFDTAQSASHSKHRGCQSILQLSSPLMSNFAFHANNLLVCVESLGELLWGHVSSSCLTVAYKRGC